MANELIPEDSVNLPINDLCRNSIELVEYARSIAARQINLVQLMTFYAIGRWIVEVEQQGESRAKYGRQIIKNLSEAMNKQFGSGFSVDTLENARKFYQTYQTGFPRQCFGNSQWKNPKRCFAFLRKRCHSHSHGRIICC